jgi:EAL domain-containing protein (putative c-di-GMP-specific phosphodiesterase class I)
MNVLALERQFIEQNLRRAMERHELELHYQPKYNLKSRNITGVEALLRWNHPVRGSISPATFIPVAEDSGLILPIGMWVLEEACRQARAWLDAGLPKINMAVNVSGRQFQSESFQEKVMATLDQFSIDPTYLELEVTESILMTTPELTASLLQSLRLKGIRVAFDDFGTGYSSLSYLRRFPIDTLKIDQSFVRQIDTADGLGMVKTIVDMGRNLGMRIVAEGVETELEASLLESTGCERAQGYYFSRPLTPANLAPLLEKSARASRFSFKVPIVFSFAGGNVKGNAENISESGMLADFGRGPEVWATGRVVAQIGGWRLNAGVRVVRVEGRMTAFTFQELSDQDRIKIQKLLKDGNKGLF